MEKVKILVHECYAFEYNAWLAKRTYTEVQIYGRCHATLGKFGLAVYCNGTHEIAKHLEDMPDDFWVSIDGYVDKKGHVSYDGPYFYMVTGFKNAQGELFVKVSDASIGKD